MTRSETSGYALTILVPTFNECDNVAPLIERLRIGLPDLAWQVIFIDDNSPDGTAEAVRALGATSPHIGCIRRIGRRGLAGAVIEGALASSAPFIAVIDGDQQHDESILPVMLQRLRDDECDLIIGSRFLETQTAKGLSQQRNQASLGTNKIVNAVLRTRLSDPLSGCFMMKRESFDKVAHKLYPEGFKILIDLIGALPKDTRITEAPLNFRERVSGESKLDARIVLDFICVLIRRISGCAIPSWFVPALIIALLAVPTHILTMAAALEIYDPIWANAAGALAAMSLSYLLGNGLTYRDRQYRGLWVIWGWIRYGVLSVPGLGINMAVAMAGLSAGWHWSVIGLAAASAGLIWNTILVANARR